MNFDQCPAFTQAELEEFYKYAPNAEELLNKAILAVGIAGKCPGHELIPILVNDLKVYETKAFIRIQKEMKQQQFKIIGSALTIVKRYVRARQHLNHPQSFLIQRNGIFHNEPIVLSMIDSACQAAAKFLALPEPFKYDRMCLLTTAESIADEEAHDGGRKLFHYR
ncbi:hypothetical protein QAD02_000219 [Eretmocerus hayati]|uniref:Uncharacterized protein n=1 Tax=Eretmocerus hayati TaxID=131215 RepID=A0ACC2NCS6_9HYME|nr:hypothetical protein QAD02_000219 [Eretmocerus hayati]